MARWQVPRGGHGGDSTGEGREVTLSLWQQAPQPDQFTASRWQWGRQERAEGQAPRSDSLGGQTTFCPRM